MQRGYIAFIIQYHCHLWTLSIIMFFRLDTACHKYEQQGIGHPQQCMKHTKAYMKKSTPPFTSMFSIMYNRQYTNYRLNWHYGD